MNSSIFGVDFASLSNFLWYSDSAWRCTWYWLPTMFTLHKKHIFPLPRSFNYGYVFSHSFLNFRFTFTGFWLALSVSPDLLTGGLLLTLKKTKFIYTCRIYNKYFSTYPLLERFEHWGDVDCFDLLTNLSIYNSFSHQNNV